MQVGKEGVSTPKSYGLLGVLPLELIKSGTRVLQVSYPSVTLVVRPALVKPAVTGDRTTNLSISAELTVYPFYRLGHASELAYHPS